MCRLVRCAVVQLFFFETVPGTGEVARFPAETLGTHKDGNTEHNVTSTGSPTANPGNESLTKQPHCTIEGVQTSCSFAYQALGTRHVDRGVGFVRYKERSALHAAFLHWLCQAE
jgi:hypothetical protein